MTGREAGQTPPHEYFVDLAKRAPRVPANKLTSFEREHGHQQFGNNFYLLFLARQRAERDPEVGQGGIQFYLKNAEEQYGEQWRSFLETNRGTINNIDQALDGLEPYNELLRHHLDLLEEGREKGDYSMADEFYKLAPEQVGIYAWRRLNSLLEKTAKQMKKTGINPHDFFA